MMPEHDPQPGRGSGPPDEGSGRAAHDHADDEVVQMSSRRGAAPAETDDTVVDLRPRDALVASDALPTSDEPLAPDPGSEAPVERRSPEVAAIPPPPVPEVEPTSVEVVPPASALSHRVLRAASPALVVMVVAAVLAGAAVLRSGSDQRAATRWEELAVAESERAASVDLAWSAVLASVAAGVGQPVSSAERLPELLGDAAPAAGVVAPGDGADTEVAAAERERSGFVDDVRAAVDRTDAAPVELGNELDGLQRSYTASSTASAALTERARVLAASARDDAAASGTLALVVLLAGIAVAIAAAEFSRRRLVWGLDGPVAGLQRGIDRVGTETPTESTDVRGFHELTWLVGELRRRTGTAQVRAALLRRRAEWGEQSRRIFEALELAEDEPSSYAVLERALRVVGGERPVELLLAERGSTSLHAVAANPAVAAPGCPVDITTSCVALRRGQVSVFDSSESINACPKLRDRPGGPCSAACVPVTVAGRPVGVVHMTAPDGAPPAADVVEQLVSLASQTGTRFSALRTLESSRQEASTDGLTGLPNRRTLEAQIGELYERDTPFVMVLADLDRFKLLNDNFGHEVGDKALQLFAGVLRDNVRGNDVVARLGGEEFVLVYPNMSVEISLEAIDRVRAALARALDASTVPSFTCSFGIAHSTVAHDGDAVLRVADAGLLQAKDLGGDQAVVADADLAATIFADDAPLRARRDQRP